MARTHARTLLALALLGIFFLFDVSVKGEPRGEQQEEEEEERSCQGAFDLYFVLDKWVSDIIYGFVTFSSLRIAMQPPCFLEAHGADSHSTFLPGRAVLQVPSFNLDFMRTF